MTDIDLGTFGVWRPYNGFTPESAAAIEGLGYGTVWLGGSPSDELADVEPLLQATDTLKVATGIVNIWNTSPAAIAESVHRIDAKYPGRFLLGVGVGHPEATAEYRSPFQALTEYLDELDAHGVPAERRVLAALGPKVLQLSVDRGAGAHPYLTTPEHTRQAREVLGAGAILAPEQKVVVDEDVERARATGRDTVDMYLHLKNYVANLKRLGYSDVDVAPAGSDRLIDDLALHGTATEIAAGLQAHVDAGASHVAIQVLPAKGDPLPTLAALSEVLFPR